MVDETEQQKKEGSSMDCFDQFYTQYPRKEAKKDGFKAWCQLTQAQREKALVAIEKHAKRWTLLETDKHLIPLPASWLRGWRFDDEIDLREAVKAICTKQAWWTTEPGILAKGRELGLSPNGGETFEQFKSRIIEVQRRSA